MGKDTPPSQPTLDIFDTTPSSVETPEEQEPAWQAIGFAPAKGTPRSLSEDTRTPTFIRLVPDASFRKMNPIPGEELDFATYESKIEGSMDFISWYNPFFRYVFIKDEVDPLTNITRRKVKAYNGINPISKDEYDGSFPL